MKATAIAHPNIALSKYWGKREGRSNVPAVPSLSMTLEGLATTTEVVFDPALAADTLSISGVAAPVERATELLDRVRAEAGVQTRARIVSTNDFPTASGLASSASGVAALALASVRAAGLDWSVERVADLARQSSASAARSLYGGFVELDGASARPVAPANHIDVRVLVCVTTESAKDVSSRDGMAETARRSPYYAAWLDVAPRIHVALRAALLARDVRRVGELAEESALAMHASAMAAGIIYASGATLEALKTVRALRRVGLAAYATMDAGPHLKCFVDAKDSDRAKVELARTPGVLRIIEASLGEGARIVHLSGPAEPSARGQRGSAPCPPLIGAAS